MRNLGNLTWIRWQPQEQRHCRVALTLSRRVGALQISVIIIYHCAAWFMVLVSDWITVAGKTAAASVCVSTGRRKATACSQPRQTSASPPCRTWWSSTGTTRSPPSTSVWMCVSATPSARWVPYSQQQFSVAFILLYGPDITALVDWA